jgi:DNA-binding GntR family transcriptional regulator
MSEQPMTPFGLLQKEALPDQVINLILDLIQQQQLTPGDKLPPERELAASMGIARQTLRSALSALAAIDVLEIRQGAGAFITDLKPDKLIDRLKFFISLNESSVHEFFEARTSIELTVVALAATRATDEQLPHSLPALHSNSPRMALSTSFTMTWTSMPRLPRSLKTPSLPSFSISFGPSAAIFAGPLP